VRQGVGQVPELANTISYIHFYRRAPARRCCSVAPESTVDATYGRGAAALAVRAGAKAWCLVSVSMVSSRLKQQDWAGVGRTWNVVSNGGGRQRGSAPLY
jgi:hypothetical protein